MNDCTQLNSVPWETPVGEFQVSSW